VANFRLTDLTRSTLADQLQVLIDSGGVAGTIKFYTGTQPATADTAITSQTLLATLTFSYPCAPAAVAGVLTFSAITQDVSADNTGTAEWARIADSTGVTIFDCDVTATGGGGTIQLNTTSIVTGGPVQMSSLTITVPAG
jgi:hypothetical protein